MILTSENYYNKEVDLEYMSVSQFKLFEECEAKALATIQGQEDATSKVAFLEGQFFEALVAGDKDLFMAKHHEELISSRGTTKGELKANFKDVLNAANKFNEQKFFKDIIDKCEKQVILTGEIEGIKVKCALDLFDKETNSIYDIKCMSDFKDQWSKKDKMYIHWYYQYNYDLQLAVYKEIVRQNFGEPKEVGLIAATKEKTPDIDALSFDLVLLNMELDYFKSKIKHYDNIKKGVEKPEYCGECDYCKKMKTISCFRRINYE